ncbi:MAG: hypothetical protein H0V65_05505 [Chitinophagales bacterium]|nr:hypothetical protein [Chitinophagales bacterium]
MVRQIWTFILLFAPYLLFGQSNSTDKRAISIADSVTLAMGGKANWDSVHYLKWTFFGKRTLYWDKWSGNVRIEIPSKELVILTNLNTHKGKVFYGGKELTNSDSNAYYMDHGYKIWANDSYWLIMPFKLLDPGVTLLYKGTVNDKKGDLCFQLELTFNEVGVTPENKYNIYINRKTYQVTQWDYFEKYTNLTPDLSNPWEHYQYYGKILLSDDRGPEMGKLTDVAVMDTVSKGLFQTL